MKKKVFESIKDSTNNFAVFAALRADANKLKRLEECWSRIKKADIDLREKKLPSGIETVYSVGGPLFTDRSRINSDIYKDILKKEEKEKIYNLSDFIFIMNEIFPAASLHNNPLLDVNSNFSLEKNTLNKVYRVKFRAGDQKEREKTNADGTKKMQKKMLKILKK